MEKERKKRIITVAKYWTLFALANFVFDYLFRTSNIDIVRNLSISLGVALAVMFFGDKVNKGSED